MTSFRSALDARYGSSLASPSAAVLAADAQAHPVIESLLGHRSVRAFLPDPVAPEVLHALVAAAQSAATSSNLQAWSVIAVQDADRKARLAEFAGGQAHIRQCPLFLLWIADLSRLDRVGELTGVPAKANDYLEMFLVAVVDAALAAQNAVVAAEALGLGTVYIGAMRNHPEAVYQDGSENRPVGAELESIAGYDQVMRAFQASQAMPAADWSAQSATRVRGPESLSGRDRVKAALAALGFPLA
ncbi:MAG: nitroreductase family protein [Burkholderiales bacterium]|nr:nitroreductase family protein [Burkholderiales bacterium]